MLKKKINNNSNNNTYSVCFKFVFSKAILIEILSNKATFKLLKSPHNNINVLDIDFA